MAVINFQGNQTVDGTSGSDLMTGNDTAGNNNDLVYSHQGNDTITFDVTLNNSTLYGGQDNDVLQANNGSALYGNFGDDIIEVFGNSSVLSSSDALYGGQGNDFEQLSTFAVVNDGMILVGANTRWRLAGHRRRKQPCRYLIRRASISI